MDKHELRIMQKGRLASFTGKEAESAALSAMLASLPELASCDALLAYSPLPSEPSIAWESLGKDVLYPYIAGSGSMEFGRGPLIRKGAFGIMEPKREAACYRRGLAAVPLLGWGRDMARLGRGGGYYDRYIEANRERLVTVGIAFSVSYIEGFTGEAHDAIMDIIITPSSVLRRPGMRAWQGSAWQQDSHGQR